MTLQDVFLGLFWPLMPLSMWAAYVMWVWAALPTLRAGHALENPLAVGQALIATALAGESVVYGTIRWFPDNVSWMNHFWHIVGPIKTLYVVGMVFVAAAAVPLERRVRRATAVATAAAGLWLFGSAVSYLS